MTNWIRAKENPGSRMNLPPGKSDVTAMSYLTMQRSELRGYYTSPIEKVKTILCQYAILLCTRIYAPTCVRPISKSPEFNRGSCPRTRHNRWSATTIHPDPIPSFYPATLD